MGSVIEAFVDARSAALVFLAVSGLCLFAGTSVASAADYTLQSSGGASIVPGKTDIGNHCDDCTTPITFPFPVTFYGASYTNAVVSANGQIQFGRSVAIADGTPDAQCPLPDSRYSDPTLFVWHRNHFTGSVELSRGLAAPAGTGIFTDVTGTAPNRDFIVEWRTHYFGPGFSSANFEAIFHEGSTTITTIYGSPIGDTSEAEIGTQQTAAGPFTQFVCNPPVGVDGPQAASEGPTGRSALRSPVPTGTRVDYLFPAALPPTPPPPPPGAGNSLGGNGGNGGNGGKAVGDGGNGGNAGPCGGGGAGGGGLASAGGGAGGGGCFGVDPVQSLSQAQVRAFAGVAQDGTTVRADAFADLGVTTRPRASRARAHMQLIGSRLMRGLRVSPYSVIVHLNRKARRALKGKRRIKVSLRLKMTAPTGPPLIVNRIVTLKR